MKARLALCVNLRLLAVSILSLAVAPTQAQPGGKPHSLRGQIVDGVSGQPLAGVEIGLDGLDRQPAAEAITPDAEGRFVFNGLAAGEYILFASRSDFGRVYFDELPDPRRIQTVHIKPEETVKTVVFHVVPRSALSGTVRDELSDPMERARVSLYRAVWVEGRLTLQLEQERTTDDRGRYRIGNLPPGGYVVCASPASANNGSGTVAAAGGPVDFASRAEPRFYFRTCIPEGGASSRSPVQLASGRQSEIDLTLRAASAFSLRGRLLNLPPGIGTGVQLIPEGGFPAAQILSSGSVGESSGTVGEGKFAFQGASPGRYRLQAVLNWQQQDGPPKRLIAQRSIEITGANLEGIELPLDPPAVVDVVLHGAEQVKAELGTFDIGLRSSWGVASAQRQGDGSLRFGSLFAGSYWFLTHPKSICVQSAKLGEEDALRGAVTVKSGLTAQLDVTLSKDCGQIQGRVVSDGKIVPNAKVVLLVSGSAKEPGNMLTDHADDEGEFSFTGLAPGRYLLWSWREDAGGSFVGPASLESVEAQATAVTITKGEPEKIDVPTLEPEKPPK